jgi:hypothetical protein
MAEAYPEFAILQQSAAKFIEFITKKMSTIKR